MEHRGDLLPITFVMIVVSQHSDHRDTDLGQFAGEYVRLVKATTVGQVTGEQQNIGLFVNKRQVGTQQAARPWCHVQIPDSGYPHHLGAAATHSANDSHPALASDGSATRLPRIPEAVDEAVGAFGPETLAGLCQADLDIEIDLKENSE